MNTLKFKVFEAFAGIGTQHMALKNLGIDFEIVGISEIDETAIKGYRAIHGEHTNYGDISAINPEKIPDFNLMTYSFPCSDISLSGKLKGFSEDSDSRSSLLWNALHIAEVKKPEYLVAENVGNIMSKRFKKEYDSWMKKLDSIGYNTYVKKINAREHGYSPQNRDRVFAVSIRKDVDGGDFEFSDKKDLKISLKDLLEDKVKDSYFLDKSILDSLILDGSSKDCIRIRNATKLGYMEAVEGDGVDFQFHNSKTRRGRVQKSSSHTLNTKPNIGVVVKIDDELRIRKLTALESCRLMSISDDDFVKMKKAGISDTSIHKLAGNAIVVNLLSDIFKSIHNSVDTSKK